jgi:hypothetical protein
MDSVRATTIQLLVLAVRVHGHALAVEEVLERFIWLLAQLVGLGVDEEPARMFWSVS